MLSRLIQQGACGVLVTFIDELSTPPGTVSMMSLVEAADVTARTYRIVRRPADGLAHAVALAERYGISHERLRARLAESGAR